MVALVLAAVLWRAPAPVTVPNGAARTVALPPTTGPARLVLRARADFPRPAGSNPFLALRLNDVALGPMRDRHTARGTGDYELGRWRIPFAPVSLARTAIVLDV